jgi:hypothetical protein
MVSKTYIMTQNIPELKSRVNRYKGPSYMSSDDHDPKMRASKQRTNIGEY